MFYRSAIAPLTIVVAVVENDNWKRKAAKIGPINGLVMSGSMKKSPNAIKGLENSPRPKDIAYPNIQY